MYISQIRFTGGQSTGSFKVRAWNVDTQLIACGCDLQLKLVMVIDAKRNQQRKKKRNPEDRVASGMVCSPCKLIIINTQSIFGRQRRKANIFILSMAILCGIDGNCTACRVYKAKTARDVLA